MAKIATLKDKNGENIYPSTFSTLIYDNNGKSVDSSLNGLRGNISSNTSDEGKSIVINDGCNHGKLSISVKGNSSQNNKKGIQLFNVNDKRLSSWNSIFSIDDNDYIIANIPANTTENNIYYNFYTNKSDNLLENTDYLSITEIASIPTSCSINIISPNVDSQFKEYATFTKTSLQKITSKDNFDESTTMCRGYVIALPNCPGGTIKFRVSIIEDTSVTINNFKYESFTNKTMTPNPEYQENIISCDNPTLYVSGKNLFNLNNVIATDYPRIGMTNSLLLGNSEIQFTGTRNDIYYGSVYNVGNTLTKPDIMLTPVSPNTTYSFYLSNQELNKNFVSFFGSDKIAITPFTQFKTSQFTFTTPSNCYYVHIRFGKGDAVVGQTYSTKIMFMQSDTITDFESYKEPQTLKIPYVLRGIGEIKDEIIIREDGSGQLIQNIYNVQNVKSTGDIQKDTSKTNTDLIYFNIDAPLAKASTFSQIECYSNKFAWENKNIWAMDAYGMDIYTSSNNKTRILLRIEKNEDINTILENGLTVQYILAEPIISELTIDEINCILKTYSPTTTIYTDSNADITATYEISTSNYFQNKLAELKTKLGGV